MKKLKIKIDNEPRHTVHVKLTVQKLNQLGSLMEKHKIPTYQKLFEQLAEAYLDAYK